MTFQSRNFKKDHGGYLFYDGYDNVYATTLKLKPEYWDQHLEYIEDDIMKYLDERKIIYDFHMEVGDRGNVHYHGLTIFHSEKEKKNFQTWFNKKYGMIKQKNVKQYCNEHKCSIAGWYAYCMKTNQANKPLPVNNTVYMF